MSSPPRRILVSAYACEPEKGSEPGVGWNTSIQLAREHQVWVITRANNRHRIEQALADLPQPNLQFLYCDLPPWATWWKKGGRGVQLYYLLWQVAAYRLARRAHARFQFHLAHHLTFGKYWSPTLLPGLGIPFVWGPLGGGECCPTAFWRGGGFRPFAFELLRTLARRLGESDPFVRRAARRASAILVPTPDTEERLRRLGAPNIVRFPGQTGLSRKEIRRLASLRGPTGEKCRFLAVGRLEHWKGVHLAVRAFAEADLPEAELDIIGDGPQMAFLGRLIRQLSLGGRVRLLGQLSRMDTFDRLSGCDVLVHPSLHDFFPTVCLEGMAAGKPILCLDTGGPAVQIGSDAGMRVPVSTPEQVVHDLAEAMERLSADPELRESMGTAGHDRVNSLYAWEEQAAALKEIYAGILSE